MSKMIEKFQRDIAAIFWLSTGLFLSLSLWSYNPLDPSFNTTGTTQRIHNLCGYFGSFLSDIFYQLLGLSSWLLVLACLRLAHTYYIGSSRKSDRSRLIIGIALITVISSLAALYFPNTKIYANTIYLGGIIGLYSTKTLIAVFNGPGVGLILWSSALILFIFYSEKGLSEVREFLFPKKWVASVREKLKQFFHGIKKFLLPTPIQRTVPQRIEDKNLLVLKKQQIEVQNSSVNLVGESTEENFSENRTHNFVIQKNEERKEKITQEALRRMKRIENWELPKLSMLETPKESLTKVDDKFIKRNTFLLEDKLKQFSVNGQVVAVRPGPAVTMYEFKPNADVKISKITELADDLSLALSAESVRIIAPLPGRDVVGIETSNPSRETVYLREIVEDALFWDEKTKLPIALGKDASGESRTVDLRKMPHLLVAGTTGSGKSVFINSLLTGLLFKHSPKTLKLIIVDPKQVDLAAFHNIPHLIMPPIKDPKKAVVGLRWAVREMEKRYRSMSKMNMRGLEAFNEAVAQFSKEDIEQHQAYNAELELQNRGNVEGYYFQPLPYTVIIVEEFGDLMAVDKANVEQLIVRLAQMARACGMHLVLAMQSPRRDVVTGLIKTNIPGRISFKVASKMDSRIILDESGAERLLAQGDMLFLAPGVSKPLRHHGAWVSEKEINALAEFWSNQSDPEFDPSALKLLDGPGYDDSGNTVYGAVESFDDIKDERYDEILSYTSALKEVSASHLQTKFRLGYPRAARMIEIFEKEGVVGPANGSKPRQVLVSKL